jgi:hypothetical protein
VDADGRLLRLYPQHSFDARLLRWYGPMIASCAFFVRASALPERGWDTSLRRMMDWDLYLELQRQGARFTYLATPLAAFRMHDNQVTSVRVPIWAGEALRIRSRYRMTLKPSFARSLRAVGRAEHCARKLAVGAYFRQARVRRTLYGADLRWFASQHAATNARRLVDVASATPTY